MFRTKHRSLDFARYYSMSMNWESNQRAIRYFDILFRWKNDCLWKSLDDWRRSIGFSHANCSDRLYTLWKLKRHHKVNLLESFIFYLMTHLTDIVCLNKINFMFMKKKAKINKNTSFKKSSLIFKHQNV